MPKDLEAVLQYLNQPNTDYAYMVKGPWGCGKTHFWKNIVLPKVAETPTDDQAQLTAYVSLYGIERPGDLRSAVFAQLHPKLAKAARVARMMVPVISRVLPVEATDADDAIGGLLEWRTKGKPIILCFDDLERTAIPVNVALGQINQFVEHFGAKVVILCNEEEILRLDKQGVYKETKEKVVGITRGYSADVRRVSCALIEQFAPNRRYHEFLKSNADPFFEIIHRGSVSNLRTLKQGLLTLETAFNVIDDHCPENATVTRSVAKTLLPVFFDVRERRLSPDDASAILTRGNSALFGAGMSKGADQKSQIAEFGDRYHFYGLFSDIFVSPALAEFVTTGHLDQSQMKRELDELKANLSSTRIALGSLSNGWYELEDKAVLPAVKEVLRAVAAGDIADLEKLQDIAAILDWMRRENCLPLKDEQIQLEFERGLECLVRLDRFPKKPVADRRVRFLRTQEEGPIAAWFRGRIQDTSERVVAEEQRRTARAAFAAIETDPERFLNLVSPDHDDGLPDRLLKDWVSSEEFCAGLATLPNGTRHALSRAFRVRYEKNFRVAELLGDAPWLKELRSWLLERLASLDESAMMTRYAFVSLKAGVDSALSVLERAEGTATET
jgi:hypothetical protein